MLGRDVVLELVVVVVAVVEEVVRGERDTRGFFSCTVPVVEGVVVLGLVAAVRVREAAVVPVKAELRAVLVLGFVESAGDRRVIYV